MLDCQNSDFINNLSVEAKLMTEGRKERKGEKKGAIGILHQKLIVFNNLRKGLVNNFWFAFWPM